MKAKYLLSLLICYLLFSGSVFGQNIMEPFIKPFSKLSVFGSFDVVLEPGDVDSVRMESDDIDLNKVSISQDGEFLKLSATKDLFSKRKGIKVYITYKKLSFIRANAGAKISATKSVEEDDVKMVARNGANLSYPVSAENLMVVVTQGATVSLEGACGNLVVKAKRGGLFNAYNLQCSKVSASARTGALIKLSASKELLANVSLNGQISYRGRPELLKVNQIFGGSVEKLVE